MEQTALLLLRRKLCCGFFHGGVEQVNKKIKERKENACEKERMQEMPAC
jgi:putative component of membrane protein insertase Oxa1/YidC/SpoIIIJ protein YidD